jgi:1-phosphofructokinase/6-phosphofructokinase 2
VTFVVCPNLSIDRVLAVDAMRPGELMRGRALRQQAGGKGANVARALRALGGAAMLSGFAAGRGGRLIAELADEEGLELDLVVAGGEARMSTVVLAGDGTVTKLYEYGPQVGPAEEAALVDLAGARPAQPGEWAIVDGAAPPGVSDGFYAALCLALRGSRYRVMVDATGAQLAGALRALPDFVKVNLPEACSAVGAPDSACKDGSLASDDDIAAEGLELSRRLVAAGAAEAVVTLGSAGAAGLVGGEELLVSTPPVTAVNTVGSGDCFAAALLLSFERGEHSEAALAAAAGTAAANAASPFPGVFELALATELAGRAFVGPPGR